MDKQELLKEVWRKCNLQEILNAGYECEAIQAIDIIKEAEEIDKESFSVSLKPDFIDNLRELFDSTPSHQLPYAYEVMEEIQAHYNDSELMVCFDKDEMIEFCDGSYEMDNFLGDRERDIISEYKADNPPVTKEILVRELQDGNKMDFKRFLCDLVDANYHIFNEELFDRLKEHI